MRRPSGLACSQQGCCRWFWVETGLSKAKKAHLDGTEGASPMKMGPLYPLKEVFLALN